MAKEEHPRRALRNRGFTLTITTMVAIAALIGVLTAAFHLPPALGGLIALIVAGVALVIVFRGRKT